MAVRQVAVRLRRGPAGSSSLACCCAEELVEEGHEGLPAATVGAGVTTYADTGLTANTDYSYRVQSLPLEVGDRLMFVTDGMLERDAALMNIGAILTASTDMHPREAVQDLTHAVLEASGGELRDDATALCLDWHGGPPRDRFRTPPLEAEPDAGPRIPPVNVGAHTA